MKISAAILLMLLASACAPMKYAHLTPRTTIGDARAGAKRLQDDQWEICLSLPNPASAVGWNVSLDESFEMIRYDEKDRSNYSWVIPGSRWRNSEPFKVLTRYPGGSETIVIPHPTRETVISSAAVTTLDVVFLPARPPIR